MLTRHRRPKIYIKNVGKTKKCLHLETRQNETQVRCVRCGIFLGRIDDANVTKTVPLYQPVTIVRGRKRPKRQYSTAHNFGLPIRKSKVDKDVLLALELCS